MKKNRLLFSVLALVVLIGGTINFWPVKKRALDVEGKLDCNQVPSETASNSYSPHSEPKSLTEKPVQNLPNQGQQQAFLAAFATPILFWGRVVDENGKTIQGAAVKMGANDNPNPMGGGSTYERLTDANGLFSITGVRGISLSLEVSKDGYYPTERSRGTANYTLKSNTALPVPTADNPAVFVLKAKGEPAELAHVEGSRPIPKNGTPVEIDLGTGKQAPAGQGDVSGRMTDLTRKYPAVAKTTTTGSRH